MKLQDGDVFTRVCMCVDRGSPSDHYLITQTPREIRHGNPWPLLVTSGGHHWRPFQTCSFWDPPPEIRPSDMRHLVTEACMWQVGSTHPTTFLFHTKFVNRFGC